MAAKSSDPTKDPEFQKVVQTFLRTPPQHHKPADKPKKRGVRRKRGGSKHGRKSSF
jgi:hypothetical protein